MYPQLLTPLLFKNDQVALSSRGVPVTPTTDLPAGTAVGPVTYRSPWSAPLWQILDPSLFCVMPGDVIFRHSNLTWHNFVQNVFYSKFSVKIVRTVRIRIDRFALYCVDLTFVNSA